MSVSRLAERLSSKTNDAYGPEDPEWVQFITDHKLYLRENSPLKTFTVLDLVHYKYRPDEFYAQHRGVINQTWIFLLVNDLRSPEDFNESLSRLWIVDPDKIKELRRKYESTAQYQAKLSETD